MKRPADMTLYVFIALVLVGSIILWAFLFPEVQVSRNWLVFSWFTACLVFTLVQSYWHVRQLGALWLVLALLLVVHTVAHALLFRYFQAWPAIAYLFTVPAEGVAATYVVWKALNVLPKGVGGRDADRA